MSGLQEVLRDTILELDTEKIPEIKRKNVGD